MTLLPCPRCASPAPSEAMACPHCNAALPATSSANDPEVRALPLILLSLGLSGALSGCGEKEEDTADTGDTVQALYGVAETGDNSEPSR